MVAPSPNYDPSLMLFVWHYINEVQLLAVVFVIELISLTFLIPVEQVLPVAPFQVDLNRNFCSLDDSSTVSAAFHGKEGSHDPMIIIRCFSLTMET